MRAQIAPHKSECPAATGHPKAQALTNNGILRDVDQLRKEVATLSALLALKGFALEPADPSGFFVSRWDHSVHLADMAAVKDFLRRVGGQP